MSGLPAPQPLEEVLSEVDVADRGFTLKGPAPEKGRFGQDETDAGPTPSLHLRDESRMNLNESGSRVPLAAKRT